LNLSFRPPIYWTDFLIQSDIIGFGSLPIVILSGFFTGGVLALQSSATLSAFGATAVTGQFVSLTMIRELGAVLTGIMVSGRNASSMASELGSMVVTEQIDAMRALGVDPMRKLVTPRIFATHHHALLPHHRGRRLRHRRRRRGHRLSEPPERHPVLPHGLRAPRYPDIIQGLVKPLFFGYIIGSIGCFYGMRTTGGTEGVGRSTIRPWSTPRCSSSLSTSSSPTCCSRLALMSATVPAPNLRPPAPGGKARLSPCATSPSLRWPAGA
jgi:phospholipid/cholesterol/gamma-HCH transport system permease protein